ncbi:MAG TPA: branched-chain amino acid ABC transporter permease [Streptosporangiaceae bacterium]|nr:branched-chain amino acid ABC transporter permease [Streptosporangiaceae bacterium]
MSTFIIDAVGALSTAGTLFIVSAGLTLVFGAMRLINIAHGSFYMYGAFLVTTIGAAGAGLRFWLAVASGCVAVGLIGTAVEVSVMRRIYNGEHLTQLIATFGLFLIFADLALKLWGSSSRTVTAPAAVDGRLTLGGATFPEYDLVIVGFAAAAGLGLWALLQRSAFGWRIRAAVEDPEALQASGINLRLLRTAVFALGAGLAGLAGAVVTPQVAVAPGMDSAIIVSAFIVAIIGGLGSVAGAALGALIIGTAETIGTVVAPSWASAFIYLAMIIVLVLRPAGLLGIPEQAR